MTDGDSSGPFRRKGLQDNFINSFFVHQMDIGTWAPLACPMDAVQALLIGRIAAAVFCVSGDHAAQETMDRLAWDVVAVSGPCFSGPSSDALTGGVMAAPGRTEWIGCP